VLVLEAVCVELAGANSNEAWRLAVPEEYLGRLEN
jgi:hypothetical protein